MDFVVFCQDKPDSAALHNRLRPAHLEFLADKQGQFKYGGPLIDDRGTVVGSILIIDLPDRAALDAYLATDPYFTGGLFALITVRATRQIVPELQPGGLAQEIAKQKATV